jgi:hypothetical protein
MARRVYQHVDDTFLCASCRHNRQRPAVYISGIGGLVSAAGYRAHHNCGTSPTDQRHGREIPSLLKDALRSRLAGGKVARTSSWLIYGLRAVPKEKSAVFLGELVFGAPLTLPGQLLSSRGTPVQEVVEVLGRCSLRLLARFPTQRPHLASSSYSRQNLCTSGRADWFLPCLLSKRFHTRS